MQNVIYRQHKHSIENVIYIHSELRTLNAALKYFEIPRSNENRSSKITQSTAQKISETARKRNKQDKRTSRKEKLSPPTIRTSGQKKKIAMEGDGHRAFIARRP